MNERKLSGGRIALVLGGLMASLFLSALDSTVVSTAMKRIVESLGGAQYYSWPFTMYMLFSTLAIPISGGLADRYGHKPLFLAGLVIFLSGSFLCGLAPNLIVLIFLRGLQGIGGGMISSGVFTIVADLFEPADRGKYTGIVTSMYGLASIVGPLAGGFITDRFGWRWIFWANIPVGLLAIALVAAAMPSQAAEERKRQSDYAGSAILALSLIPFLLAVSLGGKSFAWGSAASIGLFSVSFAMLLVFILVERSAAEPLLPLAHFRDRAIGPAFSIAFLSQALMFSVIVYLPYFVQAVLGASATHSGAVLAPMMIALLLAANISGNLLSRRGHARLLAAFAFLVMTAGGFLLSSMGAATGYPTAVLYSAILGFGVGLSMPIANVNAQNASPRGRIGSITAAVAFFRNIGGAVGSAFFGAIMNDTLQSAGFKAPGSDVKNIAASVDMVFRASAAIALMGLAMAFVLRDAPIKRGTAMKSADASSADPDRLVASPVFVEKDGSRR